jgi:hypothetical protein
MLLDLTRQKKRETHQGSADRCRSLTQKRSCKSRTRLSKNSFTSMLLASFTEGMIGPPGRQGRYARASSLQEALRIAAIVEQEELLESRSEAFYLETDTRRTTPPTGLSRGPKNFDYAHRLESLKSSLQV